MPNDPLPTTSQPPAPPIPPPSAATSAPLAATIAPLRRLTPAWLWAVAPYLLVAALSLLAMFVSMQLWRADPRVPLDYEGDSMSGLMLAKSVVDHGWYQTNPSLGAPAGMELYKFPAGDNLCMFGFKFLANFTSDPALIENLFYALTFPAVALAALWALRGFGLSAGPAVFASFVYTILPFHYMRGTGHLFYTAYFLVPLVILVAWWIVSGGFWQPPSPGGGGWHKRRLLSAGLICLTMGFDMVYHPFFSCFLLAVAGVRAVVSRRDWRSAGVAAACVALLCVVVGLNLLPNHFLGKQKVDATAVSERHLEDAETYGLKIAQLLLPLTDHPAPALARIKAQYNQTHLPYTEADMATLGIVSSLGFLFLVARLLFGRWRRPSAGSSGGATGAPDAFDPLLDNLSAFNAAIVLLATVGGFSSLFALLVSPQIRAYNRISTFIAFCALAAVAVLLERGMRRWAARPGARGAFFGGLLLVGLGAVWDQSSANYVRDYASLAADYRADAQFCHQIESRLPYGSMIFELPYMAFPENGSLVNMHDYAEFRPYIHSRKIRWSYGSLRGTANAYWEQEVSAQTPEVMAGVLKQNGFAGIYIDRYGYVDRAAALEQRFDALLGTNGKIVCPRNRLIFYPLGAAALPNALPDLQPAWVSGFYGLETASDGSGNWRWGAGEGNVRLQNLLSRPRRLRLTTTFRTSYPEMSTLQIRGGGLNEQVAINDSGQGFSRIIELPPGITEITFRCAAKPAAAPGDSRTLVWRLDDFKLENAD